MEKTADMPIWVYLALSSIETKKTALWLIVACAVFSVYCIPWVLIAPDADWVGEVFLIEDWSWFAMMIPMTAWYCLSFRWADKNARWKTQG